MDIGVKILSIGAISIAVLACVIVADVGFDDARVINRITGRAALADACLPALRRELAGRGFQPTDIELVPKTGGMLTFWQQGLAADFSFEDGPAETRVDGIMTCVPESNDVRVEFRTSATPLRASEARPKTPRITMSQNLSIGVGKAS